MGKEYGYFKVKAKNKISEMNIGDVINESDFSTLTPDGNFVQLEYIEYDEKAIQQYEVTPGIWVINSSQAKGMFLESTSFINDKILEEFVHTKHITDKIDLFFSKIDVYYEMGFEVPKRAALLYGPPGTGKSTSITKITEQYGNDGKTAVIVWPTFKYEAQHVKDFIKSFSYKNVERLIMIVEDIGGIEAENVKVRSDSSLLSLLDNQEKTFTIPVFIIATTNHPEIFLGNLTNRPNRFDDKIEVPYPDEEFRAALFKFFTKDTATEGELELIKSNRGSRFSPAHIREIVIRAKIYDKTYEQVFIEMVNEIETFENEFQKQKIMGIK